MAERDDCPRTAPGRLAERLTNNPFIRLITPLGVAALVVGIFHYGQTVQSHDDILATICQNTHTQAAALYTEHVQASGELHHFHFLFPRPQPCPGP